MLSFSLCTYSVGYNPALLPQVADGKEVQWAQVPHSEGGEQGMGPSIQESLVFAHFLLWRCQLRMTTRLEAFMYYGDKGAWDLGMC